MPVVVTGPTAPPLILCLDWRIHAPDPLDESEGSWSSHGSSHGNTVDESEGGGTGSSCASPTDESESTGSSCANSPDNAESLATSRRKGSFNWDQERGGFSLEWTNLADFEMWRETEERACSIEFIASSSRTGGIHWTQKQHFVCGREESGGGRTYEKKHPERQCKIGIRKSGCSCHIIIKEYPHMSTILGRYIAEHDHDIGEANIAYTRLSSTVWE